MTENSNPITVEIAQSLCEDPCWCGEDFDGIEPKAVEVLLGCSEIELGFLSDISEESAEILSKFQGQGITLGVKSLSDAAASMLARYQGNLLMESLEVLSDSKVHLELAKKLAEKGCIRWGLKSIAPEAAEALFAHDRLVSFEGMEKLTMGVAQALARHHSGRIYFERIEDLDVEAVEALSAHEGELLLPRLLYVDDRLAQALSEYRGEICEIGLQAIGDSAGYLALTEKLSSGVIISLPNLTTISEKAADAFASHLNLSAEHLFLGLKSLTNSPSHCRLAMSIAKKVSNSWVYLDHLESITDEFAEALAQRGGWVSLRGLTGLSLGAARALASLKTTNLSAEAKRVVAKAKKSSGGRADITGIPPGCPASVFGWLHGGLLGVKADQENVQVALDEEGIVCDAIDSAEGAWSMFNGVGICHPTPEGWGNLAEFISARFGTLAVHLYYEDCAGMVGYTIFESGAKVEDYADRGSYEKGEGMCFESEITSSNPSELPLLKGCEGGIDCRFIDRRFKDLGIPLPSCLP